MTRPKTYRAAVLVRPGEIRITDIAARSPGRGEVLLEVIGAGVCGTDLAIWSGGYPTPLPLVLGHEFVARVAEAPKGSPATALVGRRVVCEINNSCLAYGRRDRCEACRRAMPTHCQRRTVLGIVGHPGAFGESIVVPAGNLHAVPRGVSDRQAVLAEPLAAAIRTFELAPLGEGDTVVVLGCGRLGRLVALVASRLGARVITVGRSREHLASAADFSWRQFRLPRGSATPAGRDTVVRREKAARRAGTESVRGPDELADAVRDLTAGLGADIVVEATGVNANLLLAQKLVRPLGTVALKSTSGVPVDGLDATMATVHEIRFVTSRCGPFDKALRFIRRYGQPTGEWITAEFPLERTADALVAAATKPKVLITP